MDKRELEQKLTLIIAQTIDKSERYGEKKINAYTPDPYFEYVLNEEMLFSRYLTDNLFKCRVDATVACILHQFDKYETAEIPKNYGGTG